MKKQIILMSVALIMSVLVFLVFSYAWFAESDKGNTSLTGDLIVEDNDQYTINSMIDGEIVDEIEINISPGETKIFGYKIDYQTNGEFSLNFSNIGITKTENTSELNDLYDIARYEKTSILNITDHTYTRGVSLEEYQSFVNNADCRNAIYYGIIVSSTSLLNDNIMEEFSTSTIQSTSIISKAVYSNVIGQRSQIDNILESLVFTQQNYYIYVSLYFDPYIYPSIEKDGKEFQLLNSNPYLYQSISFSINYSNVEVGGDNNG